MIDTFVMKELIILVFSFVYLEPLAMKLMKHKKKHYEKGKMIMIWTSCRFWRKMNREALTRKTYKMLLSKLAKENCLTRSTINNILPFEESYVYDLRCSNYSQRTNEKVGYFDSKSTLDIAAKLWDDPTPKKSFNQIIKGVQKLDKRMDHPKLSMLPLQK